MIKLMFLPKALVIVLHFNAAFCPCVKFDANVAAQKPVSVESTVAVNEAVDEDEEVVCHSEDAYYPENDLNEEEKEEVLSEVGPAAIFDEDGNILNEEEDLCHSEGINYPENDKDELPIEERVDDPSEDTESESDTVEVVEVDGKIVPVDELVAVPDTDDGLVAVPDTDGDELVAVPDTDEVLSEVGPAAIFDEDGNIINEEEDLCHSEGINYPENDKDELPIEERVDDPSQDEESETDTEEIID